MSDPLEKIGSPLGDLSAQVDGISINEEAKSPNNSLELEFMWGKNLNKLKTPAQVILEMEMSESMRSLAVPAGGLVEEESQSNGNVHSQNDDERDSESDSSKPSMERHARIDLTSRNVEFSPKLSDRSELFGQSHHSKRPRRASYDPFILILTYSYRRPTRLPGPRLPPTIRRSQPPLIPSAMHDQNLQRPKTSRPSSRVHRRPVHGMGYGRTGPTNEDEGWRKNGEGCLSQDPRPRQFTFIHVKFLEGAQVREYHESDVCIRTWKKDHKEPKGKKDEKGRENKVDSEDKEDREG